MKKKIGKYLAMLDELKSLQEGLVRAFESRVKTIPLLSHIAAKFNGKLDNIVSSEYSISQVLGIWPDDIAILPLFVWVQPTRGIVRFKAQNWLFDIHGSLQVYFTSLPLDLDVREIDFSEMDDRDKLVYLPGSGPNIEVQYLRGGRFDGICAWSVSEFAKSIGCWASTLSQFEHERILEKLVQEGFLHPWLDLHAEGDRYFVWAKSYAVD